MSHGVRLAVETTRESPPTLLSKYAPSTVAWSRLMKAMTMQLSARTFADSPARAIGVRGITEEVSQHDFRVEARAEAAGGSLIVGTP